MSGCNAYSFFIFFRTVSLCCGHHNDKRYKEVLARVLSEAQELESANAALAAEITALQQQEDCFPRGAIVDTAEVGFNDRILPGYLAWEGSPLSSS